MIVIPDGVLHDLPWAALRPKVHVLPRLSCWREPRENPWMMAPLQAVRSGAQDFLSKAELTGRLLVHSLRYAMERAPALMQAVWTARSKRVAAFSHTRPSRSSRRGSAAPASSCRFLQHRLDLALQQRRVDADVLCACHQP